MIKPKTNKITVELSKIKIILLTIGSLGFVLAGIWLWSLGESQIRIDTIMAKIIGTSSIIFFGMIAVYGLLKIFDRKPGLLISQEGIFNNSDAISGFIIRWSDITELSITKSKNTRFLLIFVSNPDEYIEKMNPFKKYWMRASNKMYGTPLSISSSSLQCNLEELVILINENRRLYST